MTKNITFTNFTLATVKSSFFVIRTMNKKRSRGAKALPSTGPPPFANAYTPVVESMEALPSKNDDGTNQDFLTSPLRESGDPPESKVSETSEIIEEPWMDTWIPKNRVFPVNLKAGILSHDKFGPIHNNAPVDEEKEHISADVHREDTCSPVSSIKSSNYTGSIISRSSDSDSGRETPDRKLIRRIEGVNGTDELQDSFDCHTETKTAHIGMKPRGIKALRIGPESYQQCVNAELHNRASILLNELVGFFNPRFLYNVRKSVTNYLNRLSVLRHVVDELTCKNSDLLFTLDKNSKASFHTGIRIRYLVVMNVFITKTCSLYDDKSYEQRRIYLSCYDLIHNWMRHVEMVCTIRLGVSQCEKMLEYIHNAAVCLILIQHLGSMIDVVCCLSTIVRTNWAFQHMIENHVQGHKIVRTLESGFVALNNHLATIVLKACQRFGDSLNQGYLPNEIAWVMDQNVPDREKNHVIVQLLAQWLKVPDPLPMSVCLMRVMGGLCASNSLECPVEMGKVPVLPQFDDAFIKKLATKQTATNLNSSAEPPKNAKPRSLLSIPDLSPPRCVQVKPFNMLTLPSGLLMPEVNMMACRSHPNLIVMQNQSFKQPMRILPKVHIPGMIVVPEHMLQPKMTTPKVMLMLKSDQKQPLSPLALSASRSEFVSRATALEKASLPHIEWFQS